MTIGNPQSEYSNHLFEKQLDQLKKTEHHAGRSRQTSGPKDEKLYNACIEFESIFIKQMLDVMRKSVKKTDFLHGGMAEDVFEDMLYDEYSLLMAKNSGFGLADIAYRQLNPHEAGIVFSQKALSK